MSSIYFRRTSSSLTQAVVSLVLVQILIHCSRLRAVIPVRKYLIAALEPPPAAVDDAPDADAPAPSTRPPSGAPRWCKCCLGSPN